MQKGYHLLIPSTSCQVSLLATKSILYEVPGHLISSPNFRPKITVAIMMAAWPWKVASIPEGGLAYMLVWLNRREVICGVLTDPASGKQNHTVSRPQFGRQSNGP